MNDQKNTDPSFGDRLQRLMDERQMTRADLARHIWGTMEDERGYTVARNRQLVGKYVAGTVTPSEKAMRLIAEALKVSYAELDPSSDPTRRPGSGIVLTAVDRRNYRLDLSLVVPSEVATKVITLVSDYAK